MSTDSPPPLQVANRIEGLRSRFAPAGIDALVVTTLPNLRYLTGFSGSAGLLVVTGDGALLTTDGRYRTQADEQVTAAGAGGLVGIEIGGPQAQRDAVRSLVSGSGEVEGRARGGQRHLGRQPTVVRDARGPRRGPDLGPGGGPP